MHKQAPLKEKCTSLSTHSSCFRKTAPWFSGKSESLFKWHKETLARDCLKAKVCLVVMDFSKLQSQYFSDMTAPVRQTVKVIQLLTASVLPGKTMPQITSLTFTFCAMLNVTCIHVSKYHLGLCYQRRCNYFLIG